MRRGGEVLIQFLDRLPQEAREALTRAWRPRSLKPGEVLFRPDDPADELHFVLKGRVRLYRIGENAREVSLAVCSPGDLCGENALARAAGPEPEKRHECFAEAMGPGETRSLGGESLLRLLQEHPALGVTISTLLARQLRDAQVRLGDSVFLEVSQRLARALLAMANEPDVERLPNGTRLNGQVSHQELAHLVGSTRETVTKILGEFRAAGLLDLGYRRITLTNLGGLRAAAEGEE